VEVRGGSSAAAHNKGKLCHPGHHRAAAGTVASQRHGTLAEGSRSNKQCLLNRALLLSNFLAQVHFFLSQFVVSNLISRDGEMFTNFFFKLQQLQEKPPTEQLNFSRKEKR
jgi:hypothetical protein